MWRRDFMAACDPAEAVEVLDLLLRFFGNGERWVKGRLSDRRGSVAGHKDGHLILATSTPSRNATGSASTRSIPGYCSLPRSARRRQVTFWRPLPKERP